MRSVGGVLAIALFVLFLAAPPPARGATDTLAALAGHWHCAVTGRHAAERYYYLFATAPPGSRTLYGREDTIEPDGQPSEAFERIVQRADGGATLEAFEGGGEAQPGDAASLHFVDDLSGDGFTLTYSVDANTMQRIAANKRTTLDSERCARVPEQSYEASCRTPNVPATVLQAAEPAWPTAARLPRQASGLVQIVITLDDHSRILWTEIVKSDNHLFDEEAVRSARFSTYRTMIRNCRPVPASYLFTVSFGI